MSFDYPDDLKYTNEHEYVRLEGEIATIGITAFAVNELGEIVFLDLPEVDQEVTKGDSFGSVESVKAVSEVYSPVTGTVVECNKLVDDSPEMVNDDPYGEGWLVKVRIKDESELDDTFSADEYRSFVAEE
ncbi:MAG: glycine cleavage system protein GcvH [Nostocaceae cyanobacterium]|nr:glycine cleavage system protein GcvH [Nostocaceae cyanobacterium]